MQDFADKPLEFPEEPDNDDPGGYGLGGMYHVEPESSDFDGEVIAIRVTRKDGTLLQPSDLNHVREGLGLKRLTDVQMRDFDVEGWK